MNLYSTNHQSPNVTLKEAIFRGLPTDNGLYMPTEIPSLDKDFIDNIEKYSFQEIAFKVASTLIGDEVPEADLKAIIEDAINFDAPVEKVYDNQYCLELFHGPSLAFKDFGARFMSRLMSWYLKDEKKEINILVATSGDTGSAVGQGFYNVPGINVTILYPSGKVSLNQEKQLTTLGQNITALEIDGVFDDCQALVKKAFLDKELNEHMNLSSANSINISRLIPQSFYYFNAYARLKSLGKPVVFSVPSGNFGNICGGMIARNMGLPIHHFIASTNVNDVVPSYLTSGDFVPRPSIATISNAMDVGNPSNFPRMVALNGGEYDVVKENITGYAYNDDQTKETVKKVYDETGYVMCPHTAVALRGLDDYMQSSEQEVTGVFLSTAHPAKFTDVVEPIINKEVPLPQKLKDIIDREKKSIKMSKEFDEFKNYLLSS